MSMHWEEFEVGKRYETYGRTVTEGDLSLFCAFVGYHVPLFIDEEYAKRTQYGGRIAPSAFTMSVSTAMTESLFRNTVISLMSVERGKFLAPVRAGDTIRTEVEVLSKQETRNPAKGIVTFRDHVLNQNGETVFQIDKVVMLKRRDSD
ncbi:MAG: MaoC family dehydratase [Rickettsiales bacterium]|jgi:3-hydroxybutyryl-CoA dehydratase